MSVLNWRTRIERRQFDKRQGKWKTGTKRFTHIYFKSPQDTLMWFELGDLLSPELVIVNNERVMYGCLEEYTLCNFGLKAQCGITKVIQIIYSWIISSQKWFASHYCVTATLKTAPCIGQQRTGMKASCTSRPLHLLPLSLNSIVPYYPSRSRCFAIESRSTRATTYETSETGQQVNLLAPYPSDPDIHLAILYIFHPWWFFSIVIPPSIHLPFSLSSFSLEFYNGPLRVDRRIYVGLFLWRKEKNKGLRLEIGKCRRQKGSQ